MLMILPNLDDPAYADDVVQKGVCIIDLREEA